MDNKDLEMGVRGNPTFIVRKEKKGPLTGTTFLDRSLRGYSIDVRVDIGVYIRHLYLYIP